MQTESALWPRIAIDEQLIIREFTSEVPVRIGAMAGALGLEVKLVTLPPNISGEIRPSDSAKAGFKIRINRHEMKSRQRYTIAHEIAHYLLHRDLIGAGITDNVLYRSTRSDHIEHEANRLAADLLMPKHAILDAVTDHGGTVTLAVANELADIFDVSLPAMKIRLGVQ